MGRRSYEIMGPHWAASDGPIATAMNEKPSAAPWRRRDWEPAEIFGADLAAGIADLKARDDAGTVLVHGGPDSAASLTRVGRSPFAELQARLKLDVVEEQRFRSEPSRKISCQSVERPPELICAATASGRAAATGSRRRGRLDYCALRWNTSVGLARMPSLAPTHAGWNTDP